MTQSSAHAVPPARSGNLPAGDIPGPRPVFLLGWRGNVLRHFRDPIAHLSFLYSTYGKVACLAKGGNDPLILIPPAQRQPTIFAFGAENNRQILTQPNVFESDILRAPKQFPWLGENMESANREDRAAQRRMMVSALTKEHFAVFYDDIVRFTDEMLDRWRPDQRIELTDELQGLATKIASRCFFGQDPETGHQTLAVLVRDLMSALFSPLSAIPLNLPGTPHRKFLRLAATVEESILNEIAGKRAAGNPGTDVLSAMVRAHDEGDTKLSNNDLIGNAFAIFVAGHDVPASAIGFTLYLLMQHPETMSDLHAELQAALGGDPPSLENLWSLSLLGDVVRESLRLLSPGITLWRRLTSPAALGGYEIPVGSEVILSPYITQTDPEIYSEALRFKPRRWQEIKPSAFEYLPFGYGARKCLGAAFGEILLRIVVPMIVQRYRLELVAGSKLDITAHFTMSPKALPVVIRAQDRRFHASSAEVRGRLRQLVELG